MRLAGLTVFLVLTAAGCDKTESYLEVFRQQQAALEETAKVLGDVKDAASMAEAKERLTEHHERFEAIVRRAKSMPQPSTAVRDRLEEEAGKMSRAVAKLQAEVRRVQALPGGAEFLQEVKIHK